MFKKILVRLIIVLIVLMGFYVLTPVFFLIGHVVEFGLVFIINYILAILGGIVRLVTYLLIKCKALVGSIMPSVVDYFGGGDEVKILIGFITCISFLAVIRLSLKKGVSDE